MERGLQRAGVAWGLRPSRPEASAASPAAPRLLGIKGTGGPAPPLPARRFAAGNSLPPERDRQTWPRLRGPGVFNQYSRAFAPGDPPGRPRRDHKYNQADLRTAQGRGGPGEGRGGPGEGRAWAGLADWGAGGAAAWPGGGANEAGGGAKRL